MKIRYVTFTGVDDFTSLTELQEISAEHPYVEWGVLLSKSAIGSKTRFPTRNTMDKLAEIQGLRLSGHLCGAWVKDIISTGVFDHETVGPIWDRFSRVQINSVGRESLYTTEFSYSPYFVDKQAILQVGLYSLGHVVTTKTPDLLFDRSGGKGTVPHEWADHAEGYFCGYAGGLTPDNVLEQLQRISEKVGDNEIWIDMESGVRTDDRFDLQKVRAVLQKVSAFFS